MKENNAWIDQVSFGNKYYNAVSNRLTFVYKTKETS